MKDRRRKECIAMLLAGGQGTRLKVLTEDIAKPAVHFGGKYRIIDFPLSNCVNSGIDTVGILTQYQPLILNNYIGNGQPWGLNHNYGGVQLLPPYVRNKKSEWYKGTANAIYQNMHFIDMYDPEYVLILSGDHVYKMDYAQMLSYHKEKQADCTIAVIDVPLEEASRFGIMNTSLDGSIYEFEEKPKKPKSTKASMGVYIFNWRILKQYLIEDEANSSSSNDFGKDIIPRLLEDQRSMYAYLFSDYWKDVGTIESLWEANMDLLNPEVPFDLKDTNNKIYARNYAKPPSFVSNTANVKNSMIAEGCTIKGVVENSIIFTGCYVDKGVVIKDSVIMPDTTIGEGTSIQYSIVGEGVKIGKHAVIGKLPTGKQQASDSAIGISVVGQNKVVHDKQVVGESEII